MQNIQDVFKRIKDTKQKAKQIKRMYKDELEASSQYREVLDRLESLKAKKHELEASIKESLGGEYQKLEAYKMNIQADTALLSDIALNTLMSGETVAVKDEDGVVFEPVFSVRFKKSMMISKES